MQRQCQSACNLSWEIGRWYAMKTSYIWQWKIKALFAVMVTRLTAEPRELNQQHGLQSFQSLDQRGTFLHPMCKIIKKEERFYYTLHRKTLFMLALVFFFIFLIDFLKFYFLILGWFRIKFRNLFNLFCMRLFLSHDLNHEFNKLNLINSSYIFFVFLIHF